MNWAVSLCRRMQTGILMGFPILLCGQDYHHGRHQSVCQFPEWITASNHFNKGKGKGNVDHITGHQGPEMEYRYNSTLSLNSALDGVGGQRHAPAALYPRERPGTHCIGGWVGPRAGLDGCGKSRPTPGFDPLTVHPVASRCTDWAISAHGSRLNTRHLCCRGVLKSP